MKGRKYTSGRVFTIPLLHGGYAFGVITFNDDGLGMFCNIYDHYEETDEPPLDITTKPIVVFDLLMGSEFHLKPSDGLGDKWKLTKIFDSNNTKPRDRYVRIGGPRTGFKRVDLYRKEPVTPISAKESEQLRPISFRPSPYSAARVEVAVKNLTIMPEELIQSWRLRHDISSDSKDGGISVAIGPARIHIEINFHSRVFPSVELLKHRKELEDKLAVSEIGEITDVGAGLGVMDIVFSTNDIRKAMTFIRATVDASRFKDTTRVVLLPG